MRYPTAPLSIGLSFGLAIGLFVASIVAFPAGPAQSREPDRTLKLFFGHTGEKDEFTYKRNGSYNRSELNRLNKFLRDWRKNEPARMDPHLLDLVWSVYKESGSRGYIHVISAYRSPATNKALRTRSSGVAKNSQHMLGKAMDFYIPDVPLAKLRGIAMKMQGGGVGYYPRSGSPFVHLDTGNVRAWPRMSRQQLVALFPKGNTLHLPADGKPLPGYELAVARRHTSGATTLAYLDTDTTEAEETDRTGTDTSSNGWLRRVFPAKGQNDSVAAAVPTTPPSADAPQIIAASLQEEEMPRAPRARPASAMDTLAADAGAETVVASVDAEAVAALTVSPLPRMRPAVTDSPATGVDGEDAIASLAERMSQESPMETVDPSAPIALAFAAASESPEPSEADRAILTAFAALTDSDAVRNADPALTAAVTRLATAENENAPQEPQELTTLALAYAGSDLLSAAQSEPATIVEPSSNIVLAPEPASYAGDEPDLVQLIETPEHSTPSAGQLAMPTPASGLYVAPEGASDVADLRGRSGPPVERFAPTDRAPGEKGFFTRLFASLVE